MIVLQPAVVQHTFTMSDDAFQVFSEVIWLLYHAQPPIGYKRKPLTVEQRAVIEEIYGQINYEENYGELLNSRTGQ